MIFAVQIQKTKMGIEFFPASFLFLAETSMAEPQPNPKSDFPVPEKDVKAPNITERVKEEIEAVTHSPKHHEETHGRSDDINKNTPVEEVKGPSVFERVKEEFEAIAEAILPKKKSDSHKSST